jgi:hypothetical protein
MIEIWIPTVTGFRRDFVTSRGYMRLLREAMERSKVKGQRRYVSGDYEPVYRYSTWRGSPSERWWNPSGEVFASEFKHEHLTAEEYMCRGQAELLKKMVSDAVAERRDIAAERRAERKQRARIAEQRRPRTPYEAWAEKLNRQESRNKDHSDWTQWKNKEHNAILNALMIRIEYREQFERFQREAINGLEGWLSDHEYIGAMFALYEKGRYRLL